uniref:Tetraspanin n=1 Tax=Plectus sambesii TaxID=2011161 RepID=A0A914V977_9BILA
MTAFSCLRWFVFALNLFFWIAGLGTLGVSLWLRFDPAVADYMRINNGLENFYTAVYILMAVGVIMTLLGFLGCWGAWRESQCMLVCFFIVLVVVFCLELACAILAYTHQETVKRYIENSMYDTVYEHYYRRPEYTEIFDRIQTGLECCGVKSYKDWLSSYFSSEASGRSELGIGAANYGRVPQSCCNEDGLRDYPADCGKSFDKMELYTYEPFLHTKGCSEALYEKVYSNLDVAICVSVIIGALQLVGMVLSMLLCCWISSHKEDDRKTGGYYH